MLRIAFSFVCLLGLSANTALAGTIASVIDTNVLSRLSDNSLEVLWNNDGAGGFLTPGTGDTKVDIGDRLLTIARIDQVSSPFGDPDVLFGTNGWTEEFTVVSVIQVFDKVALGFGLGFGYTFAAPAADPLGLGWSAGTMAAFYSDPANDYNGSPASIANGVAQASGGTAWWEFGLQGPGSAFIGLGPASANGQGEYWTAIAGSDDITVIGGADPSISLGSFQIGTNLIQQNSGMQLVPVTSSGLELTGGGNLLGNGGASPIPGGYQSFDDLNFSIRAVPEPSSMAIWGLAVCGGLGYRRLRRRS